MITPRVARGLLIVGIINFFVFVATAVLLGGDAPNGKAEDGKYFVCMSGRCREVSRQIYVYSYIHALSVFLVTHPLGMVGGLILVIAQRNARSPKRTIPPS